MVRLMADALRVHGPRTSDRFPSCLSSSDCARRLKAERFGTRFRFEISGDSLLADRAIGTRDSVHLRPAGGGEGEGRILLHGSRAAVRDHHWRSRNSVANFRQTLGASRLIGRANSRGRYIVHVSYIFHSHVRVHEEVLYEAHYRAARPIGRPATYDVQDSVHQDASRTRAWRETSHYCAAVVMRPRSDGPREEGRSVSEESKKQHANLANILPLPGSASCVSGRKMSRREASILSRFCAFSPHLHRNVKDAYRVRRRIKGNVNIYDA